MSKVIVKDLGFARIILDLRKLDDSFTKVGFPEKAKVAKPEKKIKGQKIITKMTEIAIIAGFQEWGTGTTSARSGGKLFKIPPRPFMSTSFDENTKELNVLRNNLYRQVLQGRVSVRAALFLLGEWMTTKIKRKIRDINTPPNAPLTIKKKKSSNPLIDTGQMINSVTHTEVIK